MKKVAEVIYERSIISAYQLPIMTALATTGFVLAVIYSSWTFYAVGLVVWVGSVIVELWRS